MNRPNKSVGLVCLLHLLLMSFVAVAIAGEEEGAGPSGYEQLLNERLTGITSLHSRFEQSTMGRNREFARQESGELWVEKPDRFRIVSGQPNAQTLVSDGKTFWSYDVDLEQVIVSKLDKSVRDVPILLLGGDPAAITQKYRITFYESDRGDHFVLEPKTTTSLFSSLTIVFDDKTPAAISIRDNFGQQILMELIDPAINIDLAPELFEFEVPDGVDVIDDRQSS